MKVKPSLVYCRFVCDDEDDVRRPALDPMISVSPKQCVLEIRGRVEATLVKTERFLAGKYPRSIPKRYHETFNRLVPLVRKVLKEVFGDTCECGLEFDIPEDGKR